MNITEANHVNTLLRWLLDGPGPDDQAVPVEAAQAAAEYLADRANAALHAGLDARDIAGAWPDLIVDTRTRRTEAT